MKAQGTGATEIAKALGIGRASIYRAPFVALLSTIVLKKFANFVR
jgi:hypothetical protein